jgi:acetyltransferase-like isoleucine patch superfamily enzyme
VRIAWPFLAYTRVSITGPGSVRLGPGCSAYRNSLRGVSIVTLSADAEVEIGPGCDLGGLAIRCRNRVKIGARSLTASALVQDALFADQHSAARTGAHALAMSPILLGNGTWFGRNACVLDGTELGDGSVIASGTLVRRVTHPGRVLVSGNPAFRPAPIEAIAALRYPT